MKKTIFLTAILFSCAVAARAQVTSATPYAIAGSAVVNGGGATTSADGFYQIDSTIGEAAAGMTSTSQIYSVRGGFRAAPLFAPTTPK